MLYPLRPPAARDCLDCGQTAGMKLTNVGGTAPTNIPLLYVCRACGCLLTIPPPKSPLERDQSDDVGKVTADARTRLDVARQRLRQTEARTVRAERLVKNAEVILARTIQLLNTADVVLNRERSAAARRIARRRQR